MPIVRLSSGELYYVDSGRGVPLVLLRANPGDSRDFEAIMPALKFLAEALPFLRRCAGE